MLSKVTDDNLGQKRKSKQPIIDEAEQRQNKPAQPYNVSYSARSLHYTILKLFLNDANNLYVLTLNQCHDHDTGQLLLHMMINNEGQKCVHILAFVHAQLSHIIVHLKFSDNKLLDPQNQHVLKG